MKNDITDFQSDHEQTAWDEHHANMVAARQPSREVIDIDQPTISIDINNHCLQLKNASDDYANTLASG